MLHEIFKLTFNIPLHVTYLSKEAECPTRCLHGGKKKKQKAKICSAPCHMTGVCEN